jgi:hypothetical protein
MTSAPASTGRLVAYERWEPALDDLAASWRDAQPFPHVVLDDFLAPEACRALAGEFRDVGGDGWIENRHYSQRMRSRNDRAAFAPTTRALLDELDSARARRFVERLTGSAGLFLDQEMTDGGLSAMGRGDFFDLHTDMQSHALRRTWRRRVNLIIYLSEEWREEWNGALELWDQRGRRCAQRLAPRYNRAVLFEVSARAVHGVPERLACPPGAQRRNVVLYYFSAAGQEVPITHFRYRARPDEPRRRPLVWANNAALWCYQTARRRLGVTDEQISRLLRPLRR